MWSALLLILCFLLMPVQQAAAQVAVPLSADASRIDLSGTMQWLKDPGGQLSLEQVVASPAFVPLPGELNLGFTPAAVWVRVAVQRAPSAPRQWLLEITNPFHDDVRLFVQAADGTFAERRAGDRLPRALWEMDYRHMVFKLDLADAQPHTLWLRLQSVNSLSAQLLLWQPEAFHKAVRTETLLYGLFFGIYATILVFHLFFWRWTREPVGGWYAYYVASNGTTAFLSVGYFQQYSHWPGQVTDLLIGILICGAIWSSTMFAVTQLELGRVMPRTLRALTTSSAALSALFIALTLGVSYSVGVQLAQLASLGLGLGLIALPLWLWWRGHAPARFFALAFSIFIGGVVLRYLRTLGLVEPSLLTDYAYQIGSIVHMLIMSLAITGRYNAMKVEKLAVQLQLTTSLESKVQERTALLSQEIDRREALESELRLALNVEQQARADQREFMALVSHEFRTPLAIINASVHHVAQSLNASQARSLTRCGNIKDSARRMSDLMDSYLTLDRMEGDRQTLQAQTCDLQALLDGIVKEWPTQQLVLTTQDLAPTVVCDPKLLQIALRNLIANAMRHAPEGTPVQLNVQGVTDGGVRFEVQDHGAGIPADELPRVFQKYFRGRGALDQPGAGLGLHLVERIAQLHGGAVSVQSTPGQGSRFRLTIAGR
jgi:signal transduction histidine kinase